MSKFGKTIYIVDRLSSFFSVLWTQIIQDHEIIDSLYWSSTYSSIDRPSSKSGHEIEP
jgi:hypothetical protein